MKVNIHTSYTEDFKPISVYVSPLTTILEIKQFIEPMMHGLRACSLVITFRGDVLSDTDMIPAYDGVNLWVVVGNPLTKKGNRFYWHGPRV